MSIKITHPEGANATVSGIEFVGGVAEVASIDDAARAVLTDHGFTFEGSATPEIPEGDPSEKWTGKQLKAYAEREQIDISKAKKVDEILATILEAQTAPSDDADEEDADADNGDQTHAE